MATKTPPPSPGPGQPPFRQPPIPDIKRSPGREISTPNNNPRIDPVAPREGNPRPPGKG